jgi:hypothetical protein
MTDDALAKKLSAIEKNGETRFGKDGWDTAIAAVGRLTPKGIPPEQMRAIADSDDPAGFLMNAGRHQLMDEASNGSKEAEAAYTALRHKEREAHARSKGRIR